jgi:hypothetical protein
LADGGQDRIRLQTIKGKVGYRIVKFDVLSGSPSANTEHVVQIWTQEQSAVVSTINFTLNEWLATAWESGGGYSRPENAHIIFDPRTVNQDIYITHFEVVGAAACNYYLVLEVIPLDDKGAEYTTIKDLRTRGF